MVESALPPGSSVTDGRSGIGDEARIFIAAIAFRVVSAILAFLSNVTFPLYQDQGFSVLPRQNSFWDAFARYDAGWYWGIAANGYQYLEGGRDNLAFFPLFPLLMRVVGRLLGGRQEEYYLAGVLVSWIAFGFAMMLVYRLARLDLSRQASIRAAAYTAVFPFAFFFGMVYSESLFLLGLVGSAYCLRQRQWLPGAILGAAMTATRVTGVMAVPGLAWIAWRAAGEDPAARKRAALAIVGVMSGIGAVSVANFVLSGSFFTWYDSITRWGYEPGASIVSGLPGLVMALLTRPYEYLAGERLAPYDTLNGLAAITALALVPFVWRRHGAGYALIIVFTLALPLSSGQFEGLGRYCSVLFPIPILLAGVRGELFHNLLLGTAAMFYAYGLALFVNVHPLF
ncbi:MAG: mannosyltransferase family protein [Vicinamibacterales bacterium]